MLIANKFLFAIIMNVPKKFGYAVLFTEHSFKLVMHEEICVLLEIISVYLHSQEGWKRYS
jgi:ABC-type branched-subunit amino acid transport system ATPase component